MFMATSLSSATSAFNRAVDSLESVLEGDESKSRNVTIPIGSYGNTDKIAVTFNRAAFDIEDISNDSHWIQTVKIPDGIKVTADRSLQLTTGRRIQPLTIFHYDGVSTYVKDGKIVLTTDKNKRMANLLKMNQGLLISDLLAAFTYLTGVPHKDDEGDIGTGSVVGSIHRPAICDLHQAVTSPEIREALENTR